MEGKWKREQPATRWMDNVIVVVGAKLEDPEGLG